LSNHWRERSFLIWSAVGFVGMGVSWFAGSTTRPPVYSLSPLAGRGLG
jgi:hypothetical protein